MNKPKFVYVIYVASTPEKVFEALTSEKLTAQYWFGYALQSDWKVGSRFTSTKDGGAPVDHGVVLEIDPPRRFSCTWVVEGMPEFAELPACLVTYDIEPAGEAVLLTMTEAHSWDIPEAILSGVRQGWPAILSSFKSLLEIGNPLSIKMEPPKEMLEAVKALKK